MSSNVLFACFLAVLIPVRLHGECLPAPGAQFPYSLPTPINIDTSKVTSVKVNSPLIVTNGIFNFLTVKNTQNLIGVFNTMGAIDRSTITGGVLCNETYKYTKARLYINQTGYGRSSSTISGIGAPLEIFHMYYNQQYKSYLEAITKVGGVLVIVSRVFVGSAPNPFFVPFQALLTSGALRIPGSSIPLLAPFYFSWFTAATKSAAYYTYQGTFVDLDTGQTAPSAIFMVSSQNRFLSPSQFSAFKNVLGLDGKPVQAVGPIYSRDKRPVYKAIGALIKYTLV